MTQLSPRRGRKPGGYACRVASAGEDVFMPFYDEYGAERMRSLAHRSKGFSCGWRRHAPRFVSSAFARRGNRLKAELRTGTSEALEFIPRFFKETSHAEWAADQTRFTPSGANPDGLRPTRMKTTIAAVSVAWLSLAATLAQSSLVNANIDMPGFLKIAREAAAHREIRRVSACEYDKNRV